MKLTSAFQSLLISFTTCFLLIQPTFANDKGEKLTSGQSLQGNTSDYIHSDFDNYRLVMTSNCDLLLLNNMHNAVFNGGPIMIWHSNTARSDNHCRAFMEDGGNFVVYNSANQALWSTNTDGNPGAWVFLASDRAAGDSSAASAGMDGIFYVVSNTRPQAGGLWNSNTAGQGFDIVTVVADITTKSGHVKTWQIDRPNVKLANDPFPQIEFQPGDTIYINAGGCAQTGGLGDTWKSYTHPRGGDSGRFYSGLLSIPAATELGLQRIGGMLVPRTYHVPDPLPATFKGSKITLTLGYQDDGYSDNGYYSHDNGDFNQCSNEPNAWVQVTVKSPLKGEKPQGPVWSPYSLPFDLVWDVDSQTDGNGLALNPMWGYQMMHPGTKDQPYQPPDFVKMCGQNVGPFTVLRSDFSEVCTTQQPTANVDTSFFQGDSFPGVDGGQPYCGADPVAGHLNWGIATYIGTLAWESWSGDGLGGDNDFNIALQPRLPGRSFNDAGETAALGDATQPAIGLEFAADESIDSFHSSWWTAFRNAGKSSSSATDAANMINGDLAVATGVFGLDGVHGANAESHPVYSLAIRTATRTKGNTREEDWSFFIRNQGFQGTCGELNLYWPSELNEQYYIQMPWPQDATDVTMKPDGSEVWTSDQSSVTGPIFEKGQGWTYLKFQFPDVSTAESGVDGQITLYYTMKQGGAKPKDAPKKVQKDEARPAGVSRAANKGKESSMDTGTFFVDLGAHIADPAMRQKFHDALQLAQQERFKARPHTVSLKLDVTIKVHDDQDSLRGRRGLLTRPVSRVNAAEKQRVGKRDQALTAALGKDMPKRAETPKK